MYQTQEQALAKEEAQIHNEAEIQSHIPEARSPRIDLQHKLSNVISDSNNLSRTSIRFKFLHSHTVSSNHPAGALKD